jgi:glycosyltransferase involved in cell wall biosynthesis
MIENKKISVCIATYNGEKYIRDQIDSILPQLTINDEIIVSDDNSTDKTIKYIENINDYRIKIFTNQLGKGYSKNFENAINKSTGEIIFICDQDDFWESNKVEIMLSYLQNYDLVISDCLICDKDLNVTLGSHFKMHNTTKGFLNNWIKTRYIGACMAFDRNMLLKILPFPENQKRCAYDYWIALVGELYYKVELIPIPLMKYRRHDKNASTGGEKSTNPLLSKIATRIYSLFYLLKRL